MFEPLFWQNSLPELTYILSYPIYRYARREGKHGGTEIHTSKTTLFATIIWQK